MLTSAEIHKLHEEHSRSGMGTISGSDVVFLQDCIAAKKPKLVVEVGVASGMSSGFIGTFMADHGGKTFHSIDINDRFYAHPEKPTGYLYDLICKSKAVAHHLHVKKTSLDVGSILGASKFDLAFVDANHSHPWPIIDTMALLPFAKPGSLIIHHDIHLHKWNPEGTGPKVLFDALPDDGKRISELPYQSIGYVTSPQGDYRQWEKQLLAAMEVPWTSRTIAWHLADKFIALLKEHWSAAAARKFEKLYRSNTQHS